MSDPKTETPDEKAAREAAEQKQQADQTPAEHVTTEKEEHTTKETKERTPVPDADKS